MPRRVSLPGADELFRSTGGFVTREPNGSSLPPDAVSSPATATVTTTSAESATPGKTRATARLSGPRSPSRRERHDEKITVYVSPEELVDLEHARLVLRADHGLGIDRGRIVREALAVVLADLEAKGDQSILVRRLRQL
jgi:hypothetical protein